MKNNSNQNITKVRVIYKNPIGKNYYAPTIYVETKNENEAIKQARQISGLSRFPEWHFITSK